MVADGVFCLACVFVDLFLELDLVFREPFAAGCWVYVQTDDSHNCIGDGDEEIVMIFGDDDGSFDGGDDGFTANASPLLFNIQALGMSAWGFLIAMAYGFNQKLSQQWYPLQSLFKPSAEIDWFVGVCFWERSYGIWSNWGGGKSLHSFVWSQSEAPSTW